MFVSFCGFGQCKAAVYTLNVLSPKPLGRRDGDNESESGSIEMIGQARSVAAAVVCRAEFAHCGLLMVCMCGVNIKTVVLVGQSDPKFVTA